MSDYNVNTQLIAVSVIAAVSMLVLGSNADAITTSLITPNNIECPEGQFVNQYDSSIGEYSCDVISTQSATPVADDGGDAPPVQNNFTPEQVEELIVLTEKMEIDDTHFYIDSRFNGVGENLRPSGSQFQIYCDKVENQNCTLWHTSADEKTAAWIVSKDEQGEWRKVFAITEATNHEDMNVFIYGENGKPPLTGQYHFKETGLEIWNNNARHWCTITPQADGSIRCLR